MDANTTGRFNRVIVACILDFYLVFDFWFWIWVYGLRVWVFAFVFASTVMGSVKVLCGPSPARHDDAATHNKHTTQRQAKSINKANQIRQKLRRKRRFKIKCSSSSRNSNKNIRINIHVEGRQINQQNDANQQQQQQQRSSLIRHCLAVVVVVFVVIILTKARRAKFALICDSFLVHTKRICLACQAAGFILLWHWTVTRLTAVKSAHCAQWSSLLHFSLPCNFRFSHRLEISLALTLNVNPNPWSAYLPKRTGFCEGKAKDLSCELSARKR